MFNGEQWDAAMVSVRKGEELGWFERGSTLLVLASNDFEFCDTVLESARIDAGQSLISTWRRGPANPESA
jgi:phosphatidylserine decarboxylase